MLDSFVTPWTLLQPAGSSVQGISQVRILEWVAISISRGSSQHRDGALVACLAGGFFTTEPPRKPSVLHSKGLLTAPNSLSDFHPISGTLYTFCCKSHTELIFHMKSTNDSCPWFQAALTCLLRNLYAGQEATVRTGYGTTDWFQIGKGVRQGCILSPCLFDLNAEYIMRNAGLEETQAGIKIARRNINNLRYADDTSLMAESEEELKSLLMKVKVESEKVGLKLNIQKTKIMASGPTSSWQIDGETVETVADSILFIYLFWLQNHCRWWLQPWN